MFLFKIKIATVDLDLVTFPSSEGRDTTTAYTPIDSGLAMSLSPAKGDFEKGSYA